MKVHPALQELSGNHEQALVVAEELEQADEESQDATQASFLKFWIEYGRGHLRLVEEVLLPTLAAHGGAENEVVAQILRDQAEIRLLTLQLKGELATLEIFRELGERLYDYTRLEKEYLFPAIEAALDEATLTKLAKDLDPSKSGVVGEESLDAEVVIGG